MYHRFKGKAAGVNGGCINDKTDKPQVLCEAALRQEKHFG